MRLGKDAKVELLKRVPLFSKLDKKGLQDVAHIADELDLPAGKEMATEGDRGREFFVLLKGEAEVTRGGERINTMKEGDFFGEIALGLRRLGREPKAYAGKVRIRARGVLLGREHFRLGRGVRSGGVTVPLTSAGRRLLAAPGRVAATVTVKTHGTRGEPLRSRIRVG